MKNLASSASQRDAVVQNAFLTFTINRIFALSGTANTLKLFCWPLNLMTFHFAFFTHRSEPPWIVSGLAFVTRHSPNWLKKTTNQKIKRETDLII